MKKYAIILSVICLALVLVISSAIGKQKLQAGYILEHENDIAVSEDGPHKGGGKTTGYRFFKSADNSKLQFTKRVLKPGSAIGYHLQKEEEVYYIISGTGEMTMNGEVFKVQTGDAILTLAGSSHGLKQTGENDLTMIINYERK